MTTDLNTLQVRSTQDLHEMWRTIMGPWGPGLRSLWMVLLDDDSRPRPVIVPIDHMPASPDPELVHGLAGIVAELEGVGRPVFLFSRPGSRDMTETDRRWGRALTPLSRWPVHLYTPAGVRVFAPDDLVPGAAD
ncbi:MAG TPA: hypothetical protein VE781_17615 [Kineosporiaceae bacterium]|jgi:hypothetical protein|nr:hypothetical protein [Kineosporiaceae bacterium]